MDLSERATVFLISTEEPSTSECRRRLLAQDVTFHLEEITNISPMDKAFQQMIEKCKTPLYIQVDADMLLESWAVRKLIEEIDARPGNIAIYVGWLWGDAEERPIQGVKIYRHEILRNFPYQSSISCEMPQIESMSRAGFSIASQALPLDREHCYGLHFSLQSPKLAFLRWQRLMQKHRRFKYMGWLTPYPGKLLERWEKNPNEINLAVLLGAIVGLGNDLLPETEMDFHQPANAYRRLMSYISDWRKGPKALNVYVIDECNAKCPMCLRQQGSYVGPKSMMTGALLEKILDTFPSILGVCLAGFGEPLMAWSGLGDMVKICKRRGKYVGIITNGILLHRRAHELETWMPDKITVSLNATTAKEHAAVFGIDGAWHTILAAITRLSVKTNIGISFVCTRQNVDRLPDLFLLAKTIGAKFIECPNLLPHGGKDDPVFLNSVLCRQEPKSLEAVDRARTAEGSELVTCWPMPIDFEKHCPRQCDSPFKTIGIDGLGNITACRRILPPSPEHGQFGSPDAWTGPHFSQLRAAMTGDQPLPEMCKYCFGNWAE